MRSSAVTLVMLLTLSIMNLNAQSIDAEKSVANFDIGNMKVNTVHGTFKGMKGEVAFDQSNLSGAVFNVCVDASTVDTGIEKRDEHLKTVDFFNVEKFPTICFTSSAVSKTETGYLVKGNLIMHGISKVIEIPFTYSEKTLRGTIEVNRFEFEVGKETGTFMVSKDAVIEIVCVLK